MTCSGWHDMATAPKDGTEIVVLYVWTDGISGLFSEVDCWRDNEWMQETKGRRVLAWTHIPERFKDKN